MVRARRGAESHDVGIDDRAVLAAQLGRPGIRPGWSLGQPVEHLILKDPQHRRILADEGGEVGGAQEKCLYPLQRDHRGRAQTGTQRRPLPDQVAGPALGECVLASAISHANAYPAGGEHRDMICQLALAHEPRTGRERPPFG